MKKTSASFFKILIFSLTAFLVSACAEQKDQEKSSALLRAYQLIDEQRTDEAIELLEKTHAETPEDYDITVTLASAYAHKGGIKIQRFVPLIGQILRVQTALKDREKDLKKEAEEAKTEITKKDAESAELSQKALDTGFILNQTAIFLGVYGTIPDISKKDAIYVEHSLSVLNALGSKVKDGERAYRIILNIILFKHKISKTLSSEYVRIVEESNFTCEESIQNVQNIGLELVLVLSQILIDTTKIKPELQKDFSWVLSQNNRIISDLTKANSSDNMSAPTIENMKNSIMMNGFGSLLKCDGVP